MRRVSPQSLFLALSLVSVVALVLFAPFCAGYPGYPTPYLSVQGNRLVDPDGNTVTLRGGGLTTSNMYGWINYFDYNGALNYLKQMVDLVTNNQPMYEKPFGWYPNYIRIGNIPVWFMPQSVVNSTDPGTLNSLSNAGYYYDINQAQAYIDNILVPLAQYTSDKGVYLSVDIGVITSLRPDLQTTLIQWWSQVSSSPLANDPHVLFELYNEPIGTDQNDSHTGPQFYQDFQQFMQPIYDTVRSHGANNVVILGSLSWSSQPNLYLQYPLNAFNTALTLHIYPGGRTAQQVTDFLNGLTQTAQTYPIIITEYLWDGAQNTLNYGTTDTFGTPLFNWIDQNPTVSYAIWTYQDMFFNMTLSNNWGNPNGFLDYDWECGALPSYTRWYNNRNFQNPYDFQIA